MITYAEFERAAGKVADALSDAGLAPGARLAYLGKNTLDFVLLLAGAAIAGVVIVPLNWRLSFAEFLDIVRDCEAQALVVSEEYVAAGRELEQAVKALWFVLETGLGGTRSFESWWRAPHQSHEHPADDPARVLLQLYTSGTTGRPKGVLLTHESVLHQRHASAVAGVAWDAQTADDVLPSFARG